LAKVGLEKQFIKKLIRYTPSEVGTIEFDGRVYGSLDDEEEENFVPK
jgi:hypothetical protein